DPQIDFRMTCSELFDARQQPFVREGWWHRQVQDDLTTRRFQAFKANRQSVEPRLKVRQSRASFLGQYEPRRTGLRAVKQFDAHDLLEAANKLADGRWRNVELVRRCHITEVAGCGFESPKRI